MYIRRIVGDSMAPALRHGQLVVFTSWGHIRPGAVVMVGHDNIEKIKRVDKYESDRLYLLGDNLSASTDSRHFGWVDKTSVIATLVFPRSRR